MILGGLDLGSSGCKFTVYDGNELISETSAAYQTVRANGRHTLNSDQVWAAACNAISQSTKNCIRTRFISAIAVSSMGEAATPIDSNGKALGDALLFWDNSGRQEADQLEALLGCEKISEICGVKPHSMFTVCKMAWLNNNTDIYKKAEKFLLFEDYIIYRLTGECAISYSLAGRTMGFDIKRKMWSQEIFDAAGLDSSKMSKPFPSGTVVGKVRLQIATNLGLPASMVVVTGGHDQMCAAVGVGAIHPGISANGSGTVEALSTTLSQDSNIKALAEKNYCCSVHADPKDYFTYSFGSTGSILTNWYIDAFKMQSNQAYLSPENIYDYLDINAPKRPTDLLLLPYFAGTGTPYMDFGAKGVIAGMTLSTTEFEIYRALLEGLSYDLAININALTKAGVEIGKIRATGGGSKSPLWLQIKADVTGREISTLKNKQAGTLGCKMLAGVALGEYQDLDQAIDDNVIIDKTYYPDLENHEHYIRKVTQYEKLYYAIKEVY